MGRLRVVHREVVRNRLFYFDWDDRLDYVLAQRGLRALLERIQFQGHRDFWLHAVLEHLVLNSLYHLLNLTQERNKFLHFHNDPGLLGDVLDDLVVGLALRGGLRGGLPELRLKIPLDSISQALRIFFVREESLRPVIRLDVQLEESVFVQNVSVRVNLRPRHRRLRLEEELCCMIVKLLVLLFRVVFPLLAHAQRKREWLLSNTARNMSKKDTHNVPALLSKRNQGVEVLSFFYLDNVDFAVLGAEVPQFSVERHGC